MQNSPAAKNSKEKTKDFMLHLPFPQAFFALQFRYFYTLIQS